MWQLIPVSTAVLLSTSYVLAQAPAGVYTLKRGKQLRAAESSSCGTRITTKLKVALLRFVVHYTEEATVNGEKWDVTDRDYDGGWYRGAVVETQKDDGISISVAFGRSGTGRRARGALGIGILSVDKKSLVCADFYDLTGTHSSK
ncbi:MAG: hypothetical protein ACKV2T_42865 [Kofleriaceae bacterium]